MKKKGYHGDFFINFTQLMLVGLVFICVLAGLITQIVRLFTDVEPKPNLGGLIIYAIFGVLTFCAFRLVYNEYKSEK